MRYNQNIYQKSSLKQPLPEGAQKVFAGIMFDVYQWQQEMFDGTKETFEKVTRDDSVGVLAITEDEHIILTRQQQPGMKSFTSLVGGIVDPGEDPLVAAKRELLEESGMIAQDWQLWFHSQPSAKIDWNIYQYIARGCKKVQEQVLDAGEKIELVVLSFEQFLEAIAQPEFRDSEVKNQVLQELINGNQETLRQKIFHK